MKRLVGLLPVLLLVAVAGCIEGNKSSPATRKAPLYQRLGGEKAIREVVDDFVAFVMVNPRLSDAHKAHFKRDDVALLKQKLVDQIGEATGGPQKYTGKNMRAAHQGMGITNDHFDALLDDLKRALTKKGVPEAEQTELLDMLKPMRGDVVEK